MVLKLDGNIDEPGKLVWQLVIALIVGWIIIVLMLVKGIKVLNYFDLRLFHE